MFDDFYWGVLIWFWLGVWGILFKLKKCFFGYVDFFDGCCGMVKVGVFCYFGLGWDFRFVVLVYFKYIIILIWLCFEIMYYYFKDKINVCVKV